MSTLTPAQLAYYEAHASDSRVPQQIAACTCGLLISLTATTLRIISRLRSRAKFGPDDWLIFLGMLGVIAYAITWICAINNGEGRHIIFIHSAKGFVQEFVGSVVCYAVTVMLTKVSILLYYRRIFQVRWLHVASVIVGAIVVGYNVAVSFVAGFQCIPLSSMWTGKPGKCINTSPPFTVLAIVNVVTDVAILALPIQPVLGLNMKLQHKVQVLGIFLTGGIVCVFGIVRCVAISTLKTDDSTWNAVYSGIWSFTEISVGVVAACLPTLGPLFKSRSTLGNSSNPSSGSRYWKSFKGTSFGSSALHSKSSRSYTDHQDDIMLTQKTYYNEIGTGPGFVQDQGVPPSPSRRHSPNSQIIVQSDFHSTSDIV